MNISELLKAWRHHNEMSLRQAAERIGIDINSYYRMECGRPVKQATLVAVLRWVLE